MISGSMWLCSGERLDLVVSLFWVGVPQDEIFGLLLDGSKPMQPT